MGIMKLYGLYCSCICYLLLAHYLDYIDLHTKGCTFAQAPNCDSRRTLHNQRLVNRNHVLTCLYVYIYIDALLQVIVSVQCISDTSAYLLLRKIP